MKITKLIIGVLAVALIGGVVYYSNTGLQQGSLGKLITKPMPVSCTDRATPILWKGRCISQSDYCRYVPTAPTCAPTTTTADVDPPTITSVQLVNGGTENRYDAGDKIVITFSEPIDPTSINQNLVPNGEVTGVVLASQTGALIVRSQALTLEDGYGITGTTTMITVRNILDPIAVTAYELNSSTLAGYTYPNSYTFNANTTLYLSGDSRILTVKSTNAHAPFYPENPTVRRVWVGTTTVVGGTVRDISGNALGSTMIYQRWVQSTNTYEIAGIW